MSTKSLDLEHRTVAIQTHPPSDYHRLELRPRLLLPDFAFVDVDGHRHLFSEFRGRYVLLNFWYLGCGPCAAEIEPLRSAEARFGRERLTILGLTNRGSRDAVRAARAPSGTTWIEADPESVRMLIEKWFRVPFPWTILLDPSGRVVLPDENDEGDRKLRGAELAKTLDKLFRR